MKATKGKKQTSLCKGQKLLFSFLNKGLKQPNQIEASVEKKHVPSLTQDIIDLSDDDFVPATPCQRGFKPVPLKCAATGVLPAKSPVKLLGSGTVEKSVAPKPLRLRSSPAKRWSSESLAQTRTTLLPAKRKREDEVDSCKSIELNHPVFVQSLKTIASGNPSSPLQVLPRREDIPSKVAAVEQHLGDSEEKGIVKETCVEDEKAWSNLGCSGDLDTLDDWGPDDFGLQNERFSFSANGSVPVFRILKAVVKEVDLTTAGCSILSVEEITSKEMFKCALKGTWRNERLALGDIVSIHAKFCENTATVDSDNGFIVPHPDILVNSTTIASSLFCTRKSILATKFRDIDGSNLTMLVGSIAHELFQKAVARRGSKDVMLEILNKLLQRNDFLHDMYSLKATEVEVKEQLLKLLPNISRWVELYMTMRPSASEKKNLCVTDVRDIEDNYWCPRLGVKGKVDATVEVKIQDRRTLLPLELKTGRHTFSSEHKGQVILYTMMMAERLAADVEEGLLLYIRDGVDMQQVPSRHAERRDLLQRRNELAAQLANVTGVLPAPIDSQRFCPKCPYATACSIYRRNSTERRDSQPGKQSEPEFVEGSVKHLTSEHVRYFLEWCSMLDVEMQHGKLDLQDRFWVEDAVKRENKGLCFSNMQLVPTQENFSVSVDGQTALQHTFHRKGQYSRQLTDMSSSVSSFTNCFGISVGDRIVVSEQESLTCVAVAVGTVLAVSDSEVTLDLDRNMHSHEEWKARTFRIDKMFSSASFTISYSNLARLMSAEPVSDRLRSLVIDRAMPSYRKTLAKEIAVACHAVLKPLNNFQRRAILKFLMSDDYILFKGMPGTGKTTTIAALVQALVLLRKRVLLSSYTHSGVDSILLKLKSRGVPFVRLGASNKAHPSLKEYSASNLTASITTTQELQLFYESQPVVACTCLGSAQGPLRRLRFDTCIVDEASQALQPACLGPLFLARSFVLVGDTQQLPPVVQSDDARKKGMDVSLFSRLERPENTVALPIQYRMNREITAVCNNLTYAGQLECGSEDVANASLSLPNLPVTLGQTLPVDCWISKVVDTELSRACVFVCIDELPLPKEGSSGSKGTTSRVEVRIITQLVHALLKGGLSPEEIGVITPFRSQVQLLKQAICNTAQVDVSTVDQFQGKEKSVVFFSCVKKYGGDSKDTEILNDQRRLTVAVSRAKHKLIIIGSSSTVGKYKPFAKLLSFLREDQFVKLQSGDESRYEETVLKS